MMSGPRASGDGQTLLNSEMGQLLATTQEIAVIAPRVALALRPGIGEWRCAIQRMLSHLLNMLRASRLAAKAHCRSCCKNFSALCLRTGASRG